MERFGRAVCEKLPPPDVMIFIWYLSIQLHLGRDFFCDFGDFWRHGLEGGSRWGKGGILKVVSPYSSKALWRARPVWFPIRSGSLGIVSVIW